jgi:CheY-like chemotaxis protein
MIQHVSIFGRLSDSEIWVSVHKATCAHVQNAQRGAQTNWIGPFEDQAALAAAAGKLGFAQLSRCRSCHPEFRVSLIPTREARSGPSHTRVSAGSLPAEALPPVLWVEDDPGFSYAVEKALSVAGYEVMTADGSMKALSIVRQKAPRLLIADIRLPGGEPHGLALGRMLQSQLRIPVLFVTAYPEMLDGEHVVGPVLSKPVAVEAVVREVRILLPVNSASTARALG